MKIALFVALAAGAIVVYSWIYNWPIRFRPKWAIAPNSLAARYPTGEVPDNIVLVPAGDMATSLSISWRTSNAIADGVVQFQENIWGEPVETLAVLTKLTSVELKEDKTIHCYSATLTNLTPETAYTYRVGSKEGNIWSDYATFTTAPESPASFSFVYMADTQINPRRVGILLNEADRMHPEAAFYMISGDIVDQGDRRNLWDEFLKSVGNLFSRKPFAPAMGNHDQGDRNFGSIIFNTYFNPENREINRNDRVENYSFRYGTAYFIVINQFDVAGQTQWLEDELKTADAAGMKFKIVMFHHPVYNPKKRRSNAPAQKQWVPLFDKYKVDLVLAGHDHSYLRSKPLKTGKPVGAGEFGTTYVVSTGCDKFYQYEKLDIAEIQFTNAATYQLITLVADGQQNLVRYNAFTYGGKVMDSFEARK